MFIAKLWKNTDLIRLKKNLRANLYCIWREKNNESTRLLKRMNTVGEFKTITEFAKTENPNLSSIFSPIYVTLNSCQSNFLISTHSHASRKLREKLVPALSKQKWERGRGPLWLSPNPVSFSTTPQRFPRLTVSWPSDFPGSLIHLWPMITALFTPSLLLSLSAVGTQRIVPGAECLFIYRSLID